MSRRRALIAIVLLSPGVASSCDHTSPAERMAGGAARTVATNDAIATTPTTADLSVDAATQDWVLDRLGVGLEAWAEPHLMAVCPLLDERSALDIAGLSGPVVVDRHYIGESTITTRLTCVWRSASPAARVEALYGDPRFLFANLRTGEGAVPVSVGETAVLTPGDSVDAILRGSVKVSWSGPDDRTLVALADATARFLASPGPTPTDWSTVPPSDGAVTPP